ncbi:MAG: DUF4838 domain-containing protein [Victivallales bacterium]|nr:DUF4838 domain-containing protein [Victivallales bacterium]
MRFYRVMAFLLAVLLCGEVLAQKTHNVNGDISLPREWTAFILPQDSGKYTPTQAELNSIPEYVTCGGQRILPQNVQSKDCTLDLEKHFGTNRVGNCALLYLELESKDAQKITLGFGADWWLIVWFNGRKIVDTSKEGNKAWPPSITNYPADVKLRPGKNLIAVKYSGGLGSSLFRAGGPAELRKTPAIRWDIQAKPEMLRDKYSGVKVISVPAEIDMSAVSIALPVEPTVQESKAAEELAVYLGKITGCQPKVVSENALQGANAVYVGNTHFAAAANTGLDAYEEEAWLNRTIEGNLILAGGGMRGTLYAVWHFLEEICGVRWWTPYEEFVPSNPSLRIPPLDRQGKPAFSLRIFSTHGRMITEAGTETHWAPRNRVNSELHWTIPVEYGGSVDYGAPGFVHTEAAYLNAMKKKNILKEEWCALKSGKRGGKNNILNQLCLSNGEMRKAFLEILRENIESDRKKCKNPPLIYNVSFNDTSSKCECDKCAAIAGKYDCDTGLLLDFINELANGIAEDYPQIKIATLAYMNTEPVPIGIKPADNVIITLCDTLSNYLKPIPEDDRFGRLLTSWSKVTKSLFVWDYHSNFADKCLPMPFENTIQTDWQLMKKCSVTGIFTEYYPIFEDMRSLRMYLMAKLSENPFLDQQRLICDFTDGYYGKAGMHVRQYLKLVNDAARGDAQSYVGTQSPIEKCGYITPEFVIEAQRIFDCAEKAIDGDATLLPRVRHARLAADKAAYILYPKISKGALKDSREQIAERMHRTVDAEYGLALENVLPYWRKNTEKAREKFFAFLKQEIVWDDCDDIDRKTWAQLAWRPKPYKEAEVGKLTQSNAEKFSGKGSIRFEVEYEDVLAKMRQTPKLDRIGFNYLHGKDFSRYNAYQFQLKCEATSHPEIYVSIGMTKPVKILGRDEVTKGWRLFKIPCEGLFSKPCTHTYLRVFSYPKDFKANDKVDLYIDEMKLFQ